MLFFFLVLLLFLILAAMSSVSIFNFFVLLEFVCCGNCPSVDCVASLLDISVSCPPCCKYHMGLSSSIGLVSSPRSLHASVPVTFALSRIQCYVCCLRSPCHWRVSSAHLQGQLCLDFPGCFPSHVCPFPVSRIRPVCLAFY